MYKGQGKRPALSFTISAILIALLIIEIALRVLHIPYSGMATVEFAFGSQVLLDCYPTNPRNDFDIDLRNENVRAQWEDALGLSLETTSRIAPFAVSTQYNHLSLRGKEI